MSSSLHFFILRFMFKVTRKQNRKSPVIFIHLWKKAKWDFFYQKKTWFLDSCLFQKMKNVFKHKLKVLFSNFRTLLIFLGVGLTAITVVAVVLLTCQKKNQVVTEMELTNLIAEDQTIEEFHQDEERGKKIAFFQTTKAQYIY